MNGYKGAVSIIGSLWWDNCKRKKWRQERLDTDRVVKVFAPIRYGRRSSTRKCTYTMVFSMDCYQEGLGQALLVPFKKKVDSFEDLIDEANALWKAESGHSGKIAGTWGAVGLLVNPQSKIPKVFIIKWKQLYKEQGRKHQFEKANNEKAVMTDDGMLQIKWPEETGATSSADFDFILATATKPCIYNGRYPTAEEIAKACIENNYKEYFYKNREHGIFTFQDEEISKLLDCGIDVRE